MLVIKRRPGESVVIETPLGPITICVVRGHDDYLRLGIEAPREWPITRAEHIVATPTQLT